MPTYRDEAVVLRTHKLGEADRIITMLSRSHGKIRAVAKGVRRTSSRIGGRLEPFSHVDVQCARGRTLDIITQVETLHAYDAPLRLDYDAFTAGQVMVEVADKIVSVEGEPARQQYLLLVGALRTLGSGTPDGPRPYPMIVTSYVLRAAAIDGYAPTLNGCAQCGSVGPHPWFAATLGGMVCGGCRSGGTAMPSAGAWSLLEALVQGDWPATRGVSAEVITEAYKLASDFVSWHLGNTLRSDRYLAR